MGGLITSTSGGVKFPDGTIQATASSAGVSNVFTFANLKITNSGTSTPNSQVAVTADRISLIGATSGFIATSISLSLSTASTGANGLDTGTVAGTTWYAVYVISNGSGTAGLQSTSATAPTMPGGYTYKSRVGWVRTDASSNLLRSLQSSRRWQYVVTPSTNTANLPIVASGTAGNYATPTWVVINLSNTVAPTASTVFGSLYSLSSAVILAPNSNYGAYNSSTNYPPVFQNQVTGQSQTTPFSMLLESLNIYWATYTGSSSQLVLVSGYEDNL